MIKMINTEIGNDRKRMSDSEPLMKADEVSLQLNISRTMVYRLIQQGAIRSVRIGRAVRVHPTDLKAYIQDNLSE